MPMMTSIDTAESLGRTLQVHHLMHGTKAQYFSDNMEYKLSEEQESQSNECPRIGLAIFHKFSIALPSGFQSRPNFSSSGETCFHKSLNTMNDSTEDTLDVRTKQLPGLTKEATDVMADLH
jgi:hypothetical protein